MSKVAGAFLVLVLAWSQIYAAQRTWTFSQNGKMETRSGAWSFKKGGRIDAEFIRLETNNIVVLKMANGENRSVSLSALSESDRQYVAQLSVPPSTNAVPAKAREETKKPQTGQ
jgi:hypothetical protein